MDGGWENDGWVDGYTAWRGMMDEYIEDGLMGRW